MMLVHYKIEVDEEQIKYDKIAKELRKLIKKLERLLINKMVLRIMIQILMILMMIQTVNQSDDDDNVCDDNGYAAVRHTVTLELFKEKESKMQKTNWQWLKSTRW